MRQETDEAAFAKQLAKELFRRAHSGNFEALFPIADPQTLGEMGRAPLTAVCNTFKNFRVPVSRRAT
jgi:protein required for attachment to host cells